MTGRRQNGSLRDMSGYPYVPTPGRLAVLVDVLPEKIGSIHIPETARDPGAYEKGRNQALEGVVLVVGPPGREFDEHGNAHSIEAPCAVGDHVVFDRYSRGSTVDERERDRMVFWLTFDHVLAVRE